MAYRVNFMDNQAVESFDLNSITEELGDGALSFADNTPYGVDSLNDISKILITKGVSRGCGLSVKEKKVFVSEGVLFMPDGRRVEIDMEGISLEFVPGMVHYVYFFYEPTHGIVIPRCTTEEPSGEYVLLGKVSAAATIEDRPERAVMKNPYLGLHGTESFTERFLWDGTTEEKLLWEIPITDVGYNIITLYSPGIVDEVHFDENTTKTRVDNDLCGFMDINTSAAFNITRESQIETGANKVYEFAHTYSSDNGEVYIGVWKHGSSKYYHCVYLRFEMGTDKVLRVYQRAVKGSYITSASNTTKAAELTITLS